MQLAFPSLAPRLPGRVAPHDTPVFRLSSLPACEQRETPTRAGPLASLASLLTFPEPLSAAEEGHWQRLARDRRWQKRWMAAESPCLTALRWLARDRDTMIRVIVAENPRSPRELLEELGRDRSWLVRRAVAEHPQAPRATLEQLLRDRHREVRLSLASRQDPAATRLLVNLSRDPAPTVRAAVARSPLCPERVWRWLAADRSASVRYLAQYKLRCVPAPRPRSPAVSTGRGWLTFWLILGVLALFLLHR